MSDDLIAGEGIFILLLSQQDLGFLFQHVQTWWVTFSAN